ncbi:UPF0565 protein C2orf69 homolog isoform X2 [Homarus americanus]|uniref:UPF0565 protein C2orf69-like n=1 Tax=Homarus americanus TaxID=6706 RepID=A0A8J5MNE5_HOMAM|nr:UPF0565 protein C2orf69 homolog isoform X2 [Homarus americanus]KAG7157819.1 UPF0565 protein C2orf69-like [Homarus americanus]
MISRVTNGLIACRLLIIRLMSGHLDAKKMMRLGAVSAFSGLSNEMIYVPPSSTPTNFTPPVVVFFGGDVQDYPENMLAHRDHEHYVEWSLTSTAELLATKFTEHHVFVVKPNRMERKTFSCFDNFVTSNSVGAPSHDPGIEAINHLSSLISEGLRTARAKLLAVDSESPTHCLDVETDVSFVTNSLPQSCPVSKEPPEVQQCTNEEDSTSSQHDSNNHRRDDFDVKYDDVTIIGFSKGCVVLNQLITEFHTVTTVDKLKEHAQYAFLSKVHNMYWLDGGHAGGSNTWITSPFILKSLAALTHINIHIHVTPYQVRDDQRPWIRRECKAFNDILKRAGAKVSYALHFEDEPASLVSHFRVLNEFS